jgi:hypothetical protein
MKKCLSLCWPAFADGGLLLAEYIEQAEMKVVLADLGLSLNVGKSRGTSGSMKTDKEVGKRIG